MDFKQIKTAVESACADLESYIREGNPILPLPLVCKSRDLFRLIDAQSIDLLIGDSNPLGLTEINRWILIIVLLSHPESNCLWLHYRGMLMVRKLEFPNHRMWEIFHAYSAIAMLENGKGAAPRSYSILAECLSSISPKDAAFNLYSAIKEGACPLDVASTIRKLAAIVDPNDQEWIWSGRDNDNEHNVKCIDRIRDAYPLLFTELALQKLTINELQDQAEVFRVERKPPEFTMRLPLEQHSYRYLRNIIENQKPLASLSALIIDDAYISIERFSQHLVRFYVFDSQRRFIPSLSSGVLPFIDGICSKIGGDCLFISDRYSHTVNICHYIYDELMRLLACEHALSVNGSVGMHQNTIMSIPSNEWSKQCLEFMRPSNRIISHTGIGRCSYRVNRLCITTDSSQSHVHPCGLLGSKFDRQKLNQLKSDLGSSSHSSHCIAEGGRRILVTRDDASTRRFADQDRVVNLFHSYGFEAICIGDMSFMEQKELFATSQVVAAVHGQVLANMIFMPRGASVLEFLPSAFGTHAYGVAALSLGCNYHWIECTSINAADDVAIDLDLLKAKMNLLFDKYSDQ